MIMSEKMLEDYICENQESFIKELEDIVSTNDIVFVGRQIKIGQDSICDLLYKYRYRDEDEYNFIIVELKYRGLEPKDLSQISRYIANLKGHIETNTKLKNIDVIGVFVSFGLSNDLKEVCCANILQDIYFIKIKAHLEYMKEKYTKSKEYLQQIQLDERITDIWNK